MSNIEDVLRQFRPAKEPQGFWGRVLEGNRPRRASSSFRRLSWVLAAAAAILFAFMAALVTGMFRSGTAPVAPEVALGRIRQALETADTACIRFAIAPEDEASQASGTRKTGVVFLKRGNKVNLSVKEWASPDTRGVPQTEARLISDGSRMERCLLRGGTEIEVEKSRPDSLSSAVADWYLRGADLSSWPAVVDVARGEPIRDVKSAPGSSGAHAVSYQVGTVSVTLWYDPTTFKPLRRSFRSEGPGHATETYQEFEFNENMADSLFVLTEEK